VTAFLFGRELVFELHPGRARLDHRLHELEGVERAAKAGFRVSHDRHQPVPVPFPFAPLDLVGAKERVVQATHERRNRVARIEALVGVRLAGEVRVGGHLPAAQIDGLEPGAHHLHRLRAGHCAERPDERSGAQQVPQPLGAETREGVLDPHRTAKARHVGAGI